MSVEVPYVWSTIIKVLDSNGNPVEGMVKLFDNNNGTVKEIQQNYFSSQNIEWIYNYDRNTFITNGTDRVSPNLFIRMYDTSNNQIFESTILNNASQTTYLSVTVVANYANNIYDWTSTGNISDGSDGEVDPEFYETVISVKNSYNAFFSCRVHLFSVTEYNTYELAHYINSSMTYENTIKFTKEAFQRGNRTFTDANLKVVLTDLDNNVFYESEIIYAVTLKSKIEIVLETNRDGVLQLEANSEDITDATSTYGEGSVDDWGNWTYESSDISEEFTTLASATVLDDCIDENGITAADFEKICKCEYCSKDTFIANDFIAAGDSDCEETDELYVDGYLTNIAGKPVSGKHMSLFCLAKDYAEFKAETFDSNRFGNYDYRCLGYNGATAITDHNGYYKIKFDLAEFSEEIAENEKPLIWVGCSYDDDYVTSDDDVVASKIVSMSTKHFRINLSADLKAVVTLSKMEKIEAAIFKRLGYTYLRREDVESVGAVKAIAGKTGFTDQEIINYSQACCLVDEFNSIDSDSGLDPLNLEYINSVEVCYALASNESSNELGKIISLSSSKLTEILSDAITNEVVGHEINDKFDLIINELLSLNNLPFSQMGDFFNGEITYKHIDLDLFVRYMASYAMTYNESEYFEESMYWKLLEIYDTFDGNIKEFEKHIRSEYSSLNLSGDTTNEIGFTSKQLEGLVFMFDVYNVADGFVVFAAYMLKYSENLNISNIVVLKNSICNDLFPIEFVSYSGLAADTYPIANRFIWFDKSIGEYGEWDGDKKYLDDGQRKPGFPEDIPGTTLEDQKAIYKTQFSKQLETYVIHDEYKVKVFDWYNTDGTPKIDNASECESWGQYLGYFLKEAILDFDLEESFVSDWNDVINTIVDDHYVATDPSETAEEEVTNKALLKKEVVRDILAMQRSYRLTKNFEAGNYLVMENLNSSYKISSYKENRFVADHFSELGGIKEASDIHKMASQYASEMMHKIGELTQGVNNQKDSLSSVPVVSYNNEFPLAVSEPPTVDTLIGKSDFDYSPSWETLFGELIEVSSKQCESVFSLSSYFTDLLKFLDNDIENSNILTRLISRKPDIEQIELTCNNTDTMLPYIDLVNEILEEIVSSSEFSFDILKTDGSFKSLKKLEPKGFVDAINKNMNLGTNTFENKAMFFNEDDLVLYEAIEASNIEVTIDGISTTIKNEYILTDNSIRCILKLLVIDGNSTEITITVNPYYQTSWSSDKLDAMPEHFNKSAYNKLISSKYPMNLPFDLQAKESEIYLDALGVTKEEVDIAFSKTDSSRLAKDYFKLTDSEIEIIEESLKDESASSISTHELWGFTTDTEVSILHPDKKSESVTGTYVDILRLFSVLINRSGLTNDEVKEVLACSEVSGFYLYDVVPMSEKGYQTSEQNDLKVVLLDGGVFDEDNFNAEFSKALRSIVAYIRLKNILNDWSFLEIDDFITAYKKESFFSNIYEFIKLQEDSNLSPLEIYSLAFEGNPASNSDTELFWGSLYSEKFINNYPSDSVKVLLLSLLESPVDSSKEDEEIYAAFIDFICKSLDISLKDFTTVIGLLGKSLTVLSYNDLREIYTFIEVSNYYNLTADEYSSLNAMIDLSYSSISDMLAVKDKLIAWTGIDATAIESLLTQKTGVLDQTWNYGRATDEEFTVLSKALNDPIQELLAVSAGKVFDAYNDYIIIVDSNGDEVISDDRTDNAEEIIAEFKTELKNTIVTSLLESLEVEEDVLLYFIGTILEKSIEVDIIPIPTSGDTTEIIQVKILDYWTDSVMNLVSEKAEVLAEQNKDNTTITSPVSMEKLVEEITLDISNEYYVVERAITFATELDLDLELLKYSVTGLTDELSLLLKDNNYVITSGLETQVLNWNKFWDFEDESIVSPIVIDEYILFIKQVSYCNYSEISSADLLRIWSTNTLDKAEVFDNCDLESDPVLVADVLKSLSLLNQVENLSNIFGITEEAIEDAYVVLGFVDKELPNYEELIDAYCTMGMDIDAWIKIEDALFMTKATNMSPTDMENQIMLKSYSVDSTIALEKTLSKMYGTSSWFEKIKEVRSKLREEQRDALVSYILSQNLEAETINGKLVFSDEYFSSTKDLYDYYLIDTETNSDVKTSRLKRAVSSVQLFIQRVNLGLEDECSFEPDEKDQLVWMKNYRVWEANRKVFLYPENWIDSDLRDDKSPFFKELEQEIADVPLTSETAKAAFENYFEKVKDVANLKIVNGYEYDDTKYFIGRTKGIPKKYYFRTYVDKHNGSGVWTPWKIIDVEIDSDLVMPVVFNGKLHILWPNYTPQEIHDTSRTEYGSTKAVTEDEKGNLDETIVLDEPVIIKGVEIKMNIASFDGKKWKGPQLTEETLFSANDYFTIPLPAKTDFGQIYNYVVKPVDGNYIEIEVYKTINIFGHDSMGQYDESSEYSLFSAEQRDIAKAPDSYISRQSIVQEGSFQIASDGFTRIQYSPVTIDYTYAMWNFFPDRARVVNGTGYSDSRMRLMDGSGRKYSLMYPIFNPLLNKTPADFSITPLNFSFRYNYESSFVYSDDSRTYFMQRSNDEAIRYGISTINHPLMNSISSRYSSQGFDGIMCRQTQALPISENYYYSYNTSNYYHNIYLGYYLAGDRRAEQVSRQLFDFRFDPNRSVVNKPLPKEVVDFEYGNSMAIYNWELFFYLPMYLGEKLSENNQFADARTWYNYVFNPENDLNDYEKTQSWVKKLPTGAKFWNFLPFFSNRNVDLNTQEELGLANEDNKFFDDNNLSNLVSDWKENPFNPHLIARSRIAAYQKFVVMKYLDNLMEWADSLFRTDTIESITEATQLYILADDILGNKPTTSESLIEKAPLSYNDLEKLDSGSFNSVMIDAEDNLLKPKHSQNNYAKPLDDKAKDILKIGVNMIYFGTPQNSQLLGYWDKVKDRLYKIRNSMNINGAKRTLALFAPPIDPGMLVKAAAGGVDLASAIANLNAPLPHYRFRRIHSKAIELCGEVKSLGGSLLSALEKKDGEYIGVLRNEHEKILLERNTDIRDLQIQEAENTIESLNVSLESANKRKTYYSDLIDEGLLASEIVRDVSSISAGVLSLTSGIMKMVGAGTANVPEVKVGVVGTAMGGPIVDSTIVDGSKLSKSFDLTAESIGLGAQALDRVSSIAGTKASEKRREMEWKHQLNLAEKEIENLNKQIIGAGIRKDIAVKEKENLEQQIENSQITLEFLQTKYTNEELYNWHVKSISKLHKNMYNLAYDVAKRAESLYEFELELEPNFVKGDNWEGGRKGLLAGERLALQLQQMDVSYLENNKREQEITKTISLAELDSEQLYNLKENGNCKIDIPEWYLDLDFPGQYLRRVRGVNITIPCVKGAYSDINATLTLQNNAIRKKGIYSNSIELPPNIQNNGQVSLASGQSDSGVFEFSFKDERFLPFEGAGAISTWILALPGGDDRIPKSFDYSLISDVIMKLSYSARLGGSGSAERIDKALGATFTKQFSMKEEMPDTLSEIIKKSKDLVAPANELIVGCKFAKTLAPYYLNAKTLEILHESGDGVTIKFDLKGNGVVGTFTIPTNDDGLNFNNSYPLTCTGVSNLDDIIVTMQYKVQS